MITGHLETKHGYWYVVLNLRDEQGKRIRKTLATHLPEKGNKKRAEKILTKLRIEHTGLEDIRRDSRGILLSDINPAHIEGYYGFLKEKSSSNNTIIRHQANLHKALEEACRGCKNFSVKSPSMIK